MKKSLLGIILTLLLVSGLAAAETSGDEKNLLVIVDNLKKILQQSLAQQQAETVLSAIPQTRRFEKDGQYIGHKLFHKNKLKGLLTVQYKHDKPVFAAYKTVPLRVRVATSTYQAYRDILSKQYKEQSYNYFDLGNGLVAQLDKKQGDLAVIISHAK